MRWDKCPGVAVLDNTASTGREEAPLGTRLLTKHGDPGNYRQFRAAEGAPCERRGWQGVRLPSGGLNLEFRTLGVCQVISEADRSCGPSLGKRPQDTVCHFGDSNARRPQSPLPALHSPEPMQTPRSPVAGRGCQGQGVKNAPPTESGKEELELYVGGASLGQRLRLRGPRAVSSALPPQLAIAPGDPTQTERLSRAGWGGRQGVGGWGRSLRLRLMPFPGPPAPACTPTGFRGGQGTLLACLPAVSDGVPDLARRRQSVFPRGLSCHSAFSVM